MKTGSVDRKAMMPEMKSTVRAYEVLVGSGRICDAGLDLSER